MANYKPFRKPAYKADEWIDRDAVCQLLKIKPKTLANYVADATIPDKFISTGPTGVRFFYRPGLLGFDS